MAGVLNDLGQTVLPQIFNSLNAAGLTDLMNITGETRTQGTGGGQIKSASPNAYENVPVSYEPNYQNSRNNDSDRSVSLNEYVLTFPTHKNGARINVDVKNHRLTVIARGNEPAKTFRIISVRDLQGVIFEAVCEKEN